MLQNLTNFFNIIRLRRIKTVLESDDLIAVGTKQSSRGDYKATAIKFEDLQAQLGGVSFNEFLDVNVGETSIICYKLPTQINDKDAWRGTLGSDLFVVSWNSNDERWEVTLGGNLIAYVGADVNSTEPPFAEYWTNSVGNQSVIPMITINQPLQTALETLASKINLLVAEITPPPPPPQLNQLTSTYWQSGTDAPTLNNSSSNFASPPNIQTSYVTVGEYLFTDVEAKGYFGNGYIVMASAATYTDATYEWNFMLIVNDSNNFTVYASNRLIGDTGGFTPADGWDTISPLLTITITQN